MIIYSHWSLQRRTSHTHLDTKTSREIQRSNVIFEIISCITRVIIYKYPRSCSSPLVDIPQWNRMFYLSNRIIYQTISIVEVQKSSSVVIEGSTSIIPFLETGITDVHSTSYQRTSANIHFHICLIRCIGHQSWLITELSEGFKTRSGSFLSSSSFLRKERKWSEREEISYQATDVRRRTSSLMTESECKDTGNFRNRIRASESSCNR